MRSRSQTLVAMGREAQESEVRRGENRDEMEGVRTGWGRLGWDGMGWDVGIIEALTVVENTEHITQLGMKV